MLPMNAAPKTGTRDWKMMPVAMPYDSADEDVYISTLK